MAKDYTKYSFIREELGDSYQNNNEIVLKEKIKHGEVERLETAELLSHFTGISLSVLETAIERYGALELPKYIYNMELISTKRKKLKMIFELCNKLYAEEAKNNFNMSSPRSVADYIYSKIGRSDTEKVYVLYLTTKCSIIFEEVLFIGGISSCVVDVPVLFKKALINGASHLVFSHCHPSGNPAPSIEDKNLTNAVRMAGDLLKVPLLDHIIIGSNRNYYSFKENGLI